MRVLGLGSEKWIFFLLVFVYFSLHASAEPKWLPEYFFSNFPLQAYKCSSKWGDAVAQRKSNLKNIQNQKRKDPGFTPRPRQTFNKKYKCSSV
jgi:hypothetical protein